MLRADLLDSIPETRYLSADNYTVYRTIMRIFYLEHQKMHYQMDRDTVLVLLREQAVFSDYTPEQLTLAVLGRTCIGRNGWMKCPFGRSTPGGRICRMTFSV